MSGRVQSYNWTIGKNSHWLDPEVYPHNQSSLWVFHCAGPPGLANPPSGTGSFEPWPSSHTPRFASRTGNAKSSFLIGLEGSWLPDALLCSLFPAIFFLCDPCDDLLAIGLTLRTQYHHRAIFKDASRPYPRSPIITIPHPCITPRNELLALSRIPLVLALDRDPRTGQSASLFVLKPSSRKSTNQRRI